MSWVRLGTYCFSSGNELTISSLEVELRARQRTFDGAYGRSALSNLGYALTVLRLFDKRFHQSES